jgi:hypothetical protein
MWMKRWQNLSAPQRVAAVASAAAVAVWTAVWIVPDVHEAMPESAPTASAETVPPAVSEPAAAQVQAQATAAPQQPSTERARPAEAPTTDPLAALRDGLASDNAGTRIEAVRKLAEQRTTQALPQLLAQDVARDADLAPTLIQVAGQLARRADAPQRAAAAAQLARWHLTESARPEADARANVSVLVETLSGLKDPQAESALIAVLQSDTLPLHVQTLAVEGLARSEGASAQAALEQFRARLGQSERQGFELELQREAEHATDRALARLSR